MHLGAKPATTCEACVASLTQIFYLRILHLLRNIQDKDKAHGILTEIDHLDVQGINIGIRHPRASSRRPSEAR